MKLVQQPFDTARRHPPCHVVGLCGGRHLHLRPVRRNRGAMEDSEACGEVRQGVTASSDNVLDEIVPNAEVAPASAIRRPTIPTDAT